jgi:hypothetical protein
MDARHGVFCFGQLRGQLSQPRSRDLGALDLLG